MSKSAIRLKVHPQTPQKRHIAKATQVLKEGGIAIIPTDAVYVLAGDMMQKTVHEKLLKIKNLEKGKATFSIICSGFSQASHYIAPLNKETFRLLKKYLPGPFTFILPASRHVPRIFLNRRHTIGIRIPDHPVPTSLAEALGNPLISTSLYDEEGEYMTDPDKIFEHWKHTVDVILDAGPLGYEPTTVIDLSGQNITIVRQGKGIFNY